ncbi:MAG: hypothetical protein ACPGVY_13675, partial [Mycobacterium sp.]
MSGNVVRLQAINNVEAYVPPAISFDPAEAPEGMPEPVRFRHDPMLRAPSIIRLSEAQVRAFLSAAE